MNRIKLRKLFSKDEMVSIISEFVKALGISVNVKDEQGYIQGWDTCKECGNEYAVKVKDEIIGWVEGNTLAERAAGFISYIANSEMEKKELAAEALERYREINLLYKLSEKLSTSLELSMVVRHVVDEAMRNIDSTIVSVMIFNEESERLETVSEFYKRKGLNIAIRSTETIIRPDNEIIRTILSKGRAEIINDLPSRNIEICGKMAASIICAPLVVKNHVTGIVVIGHENPVSYTADDLKLFNTIVSHGAFAIENARLYKSLNETFFETVQALAETMEKRDVYTAGHTKRVVGYSLMIGRAMGMTPVELVKLKLGAMLHDIGKIGISDWILVKHDKLKGKELEMVKKHPEYGAEIIMGIRQLKDVVPVVRAHHERYDGLGYPDGLDRENIPLNARIIAVADCFDWMINGRAMTDGIGAGSAFDELRSGAGTRFDPDIVEIFVKAYKESSRVPYAGEAAES